MEPGPELNDYLTDVGWPNTILRTLNDYGYTPPGPDRCFRAFYNEKKVEKDSKKTKCYARNIFVDIESTTIDELKVSANAGLYEKDYLISGKGTCHNFCRAFYTVGKELEQEFRDRIRKMADECDNVQGFIIHNSISGGTGAGLGSLILENLSVYYRKKARLDFT
eukprot:UN32372